MFDDTITSLFSFFLFTALTHPHIVFQIIFTKRLFHQIRSHSLFCYQDELLMCLSAEDKCAKSDSALPVSKRMPSVRRTRLSLMYSHRVLCADKDMQL